MIHSPQNNSLGLRTRNTKTCSKKCSKQKEKKVLKNRARRRSPPEQGSSEGAEKGGRAVVWKSARGRSEEKEWSFEEEQRLFELHDQLGNRWTIIAQHFASKTDNDIKNHLFSRFRLAVRRINKLAQAAPTSLRPLKITIISKIAAVCDSPFSNSPLPPSSCLSAARRLKRDLLAFLYENPFNSPSAKTERLIRDLHAFSENCAWSSKNSRRERVFEHQGQPDPEGNMNQLEEPLFDFQKEGESHPTRLQEGESSQGRLSAGALESGALFVPAVGDISVTGDSTILSPDFSPPFFVGDCLSLHCAESLLPPIRSEQAYEYDHHRNELDLFDFLAFSN